MVSSAKGVRKLYLPPESPFFLCRTCHHLTYESQQRFVDVFGHGRRKHASIDGGLAHLEAKYADPEPRERTEVERHLLARLHALERGQPPPETPPPPPPPKRPRGRPREKRLYHRHQALAPIVRTSDTEAYCVKCRDFREMVNPVIVTFSNGRPALAGTCPVCQVRLARIIKGKTGSRED